MTKFSITLGSLLLATTALVAPGLAFAQTPPAAAAPAEDPTVEEIVVRGRFIPDAMRETPEVATVLLAEDLVRQGDDTAAEALSRSSGLSLVDSKFVYVRGLGERYSSALLNGSPLPSPEPLARVVPLDLFPSSILSGAVVQKTFSPNYPGEFGGGVINLQTTAVPRRQFVSMGASLGWNSVTTLKPGLTYFGSETDWTGFDDGSRDIPDLLKAAIRTGRGRISDATFVSVDLKRIGGSLINAPFNLLQRTKDIPANVSVDFSAGDRYDMGWGDLGVISVVGYKNGWSTRSGVQEEGFLSGAGDLSANTHYDFFSTQNDITVHGLLGLGLNVGDHEVRWTNLYVRSTTKEARRRQGTDFNSPVPEVRDDFTEWFQRDLFSTQLGGKSEFGDAWQIDWRAAWAKTRRDTPYEKYIRYVQVGGEYIYGLNNANSTGFGRVDDELFSGGIDLKYTLPLSDERDVIFSGGYATSDNDRSASQRIFQFQSSSLPLPIQRERVDYLFSDYNLGQGYFTFRETTGASGAAAYDGNLKTDAFYVQADAEIMPLVRTSLGVRYEDATQTLNLIDLFGGAPPAGPAPLVNDYWLPAGTLTWNFYEDMQIRLGASMTITRPQFRELAPQQYIDPDTDRLYIGNPFLTDSELTNLDARYEWYFDENQYVTAGAFYKDIDRPVEVVVNEGGSGLQSTFINAPKATIYGLELELRKYIQYGPWEDVRWFVSGNYTWSKSEVKVDPADEVFPFSGDGVASPASVYFTDGDRLQGQSDHLANLQLGFEDEGLAWKGTLLVNYASERITARGRPGYPDLTVTPGVTLDLTMQKAFEIGETGRQIEYGIEVRNILGKDFEESQKSGATKVITNGYESGTSVSMSLKAKF